ncbi:nucleosome assembly protein 1-like 1-B [Chrysoperla carnea]|uniref:nucleosome assembly protein 1-like 1-B n=1 Tax=Chrysoperla carnea TaxID=189513 RepID=UPI001D05CF9C|nr:nucleosome assembly protein 1-like 1-B [Chrysoperla carnea]
MSGGFQRVKSDNDAESGDDSTTFVPSKFNFIPKKDMFATVLKERLDALPQSVKKRIKALKKIQFETTKIESKFHEELYALELKYHKLHNDFYEKRESIVNGKYEPTEEECEWTLDDDLDKELDTKLKIEDITDKKDINEDEKLDDNVKGIPDFWLHIFKNVGVLAELLQECDEPIIKHLQDIKVKYLDDQMGFVLEFHFAPNDYFRNTILTKTYLMKCTPDEDDPFNFDGAEIYKCSGCTIDWKKDKNVTQKKIIKVQKHKSSGLTRSVTKTIQNESFFNFFSPPIVPDETPATLVDDDIKATLVCDFQTGHYIREHIVPRAVLYYTGEIDDDEDDDYDEDDEEEEDEDDDDDDDDETEKPFRPRIKGGNKAAAATPAECKQQ